MNINRNNYEVWMIDYFDGKLSADEKAGLTEFLEFNLDLKEEFNLFEPKSLDAEVILFPEKNLLKKQATVPVGEINETNYEEYFLAFHENDLDKSQKNSLNAFLEKNPHLENEFNLHASLLLKPDNSIIYNQKESLRKNRRVAVYWWSGAAAAVIVVLFGIFGLLNNTVTVPKERTEISAINSIDKLYLLTGSELPSLETDLRLRSTPQLTLFKNEELIEATKMERISIAKLDPVNSTLGLQKEQADFTVTKVIYAFAQPPAEKKKEKNLFGKIIKNFASRITDDTPNIVQKTNKKDPGFVKFLDQGITVFNTITGSDTELVKSYDSDGNLTQYQVDGQSLSWSRQVDKPLPNAE